MCLTPFDAKQDYQKTLNIPNENLKRTERRDSRLMQRLITNIQINHRV